MEEALTFSNLNFKNLISNMPRLWKERWFVWTEVVNICIKWSQRAPGLFLDRPTKCQKSSNTSFDNLLKMVFAYPRSSPDSSWSFKTITNTIERLATTMSTFGPHETLRSPPCCFAADLGGLFFRNVFLFWCNPKKTKHPRTGKDAHRTMMNDREPFHQFVQPP